MKRLLLAAVAAAAVGGLLAGAAAVWPGFAQEQQMRKLKCWRCGASFTAPMDQRQGNCPKCGAKFLIPPPTPLPTPTPIPGSAVAEPPAPASISWRDGMKFVGQTKTVTGPIVGAYFSEKSGTLYLNFDQDYKNNISIKIGKSDLPKFPPDAKDVYQGKTVIATGRIEKEKNFVRLLVTDPKNLVVVPEPGSSPETSVSLETSPSPETSVSPGNPAATTSPPSGAAVGGASQEPAGTTSATDFSSQYGGEGSALSPNPVPPAPTPGIAKKSFLRPESPSGKKKGSRGHSTGGDSSAD